MYCNVDVLTLHLQYFPITVAQGKNTASDLTSSDNVTYDSVGNTAKMATQANIACLENVAYATATDTEEKMTDTSTSHTAVYEEVQQ